MRDVSQAMVVSASSLNGCVLVPVVPGRKRPGELSGSYSASWTSARRLMRPGRCRFPPPGVIVSFVALHAFDWSPLPSLSNARGQSLHGGRAQVWRWNVHLDGIPV